MFIGHEVVEDNTSHLLDLQTHSCWEGHDLLHLPAGVPEGEASFHEAGSTLRIVQAQKLAVLDKNTVAVAASWNTELAVKNSLKGDAVVYQEVQQKLSQVAE